MHASDSTCANCGSSLAAEHAYCGACGQKKVADADARSFRHLLLASFQEVSSVDSRLWRSLRYLISRPGWLTREFIEGRRQRYMTPISLFLLANLLFFLAPSLTDFSINLVDQVTLQPYSDWIRPWVERTISDGGRSAADVRAAYREHSNELAKVMVIFHVPLIAFFSFLLGVGKRRYYADHVVGALHFFAFLMLYYSALPYLVVPLLQLALTPLDLQGHAWRIGVSIQFLYVPLMLRTAFDFAWWRAIGGSVLFVFALYGVHVLYRLILFLLSFSRVAWQ